MGMLVFPYGYDCEPMTRHADLLEFGYKITALVSPGGWGLAGKNVMIGTSGYELPVCETFEEVTGEFDSLFIPPFETNAKEVENRIVDKILSLIPRLFQVYCTARINDANRKRLEDACQCYGCIFTDFTENKGLEAYGLELPTEQYPFLHMLDVPVVVVAGLWEKTDKFEISLSLRERFVRDGYRVSQVGSRDGCEMLGFHSFPGFMFRKDLDGIRKIYCFNRWIHKIAAQEQTDVVLITIPGAVQDFNEQFTRGFGVLHYEVFQAVVPDALVMCTFMGDNKKALKEISSFCRYRFDVSVDVFHMSNLLIDLNESEEYGRIISNSIYRETVSQTIAREFADGSVPVFNGINREECDKMYQILLEKLMSKDVQAVF